MRQGINQSTFVMYILMCLLAASPQLHAQVDLSKDLVGHWPLNEGAGNTVANTITKDNKISITGQSKWIDGPSGKSLYFNGSDTAVNLGNPTGLNFDGHITLAAWIKPDTFKGMRSILSHGPYITPAKKYQVMLRTRNNRLQAGAWNGTENQASAPVPRAGQQWMHLVGVFDGQQWNLYVDGNLKSTFPTSVGSMTTESDWFIGRSKIAPGRYFQGGICEVRIYKRALSAKDVAALHQLRGKTTGTPQAGPTNPPATIRPATTTPETPQASIPTANLTPIKSKGYQTPRPDRTKITDPKLKDAYLAYDKAYELYMAKQSKELLNHLRKTMKQQYALPAKQKSELRYLRRALINQTPRWWPNVKSTSNTSFTAGIWGRSMIANYKPDTFLGAQAAYINNGKLLIIVTWKPDLIDNPKPATGELATRLGITLGDIAEIIVWHELGHNYLSVFLPSAGVIDAYQNHQILFQHVQEFFADITAIYHASPRARRVALMMRLNELANYDESEQHTRGAHAIGSLFLADVLQNPDKWPSVHLPGRIPTDNVERNTLIYVYENWDKHWTIAEDNALREMYNQFLKKNGNKLLKYRGTFILPYKEKFSLTISGDREFQPKRDQWVTEKLKALIKVGRADAPSKGTYQPTGPRTLMVKTSDGRTIRLTAVRQGPRIDMPW